ncbi:hypothetical protein, partial [Pseudomonas aeruginosa]
PWSARQEKAMETLGRIAQSLAGWGTRADHGG